jgi:hypothetical protein
MMASCIKVTSVQVESPSALALCRCNSLLPLAEIAAPNPRLVIATALPLPLSVCNRVTCSRRGLLQIYKKGSGIAAKIDPAETRARKDTRTSFIQSDSTDPGHKGKHLLAFASYDGSKQNKGWDWDPNIYYIGDFDGKTFHPDCEPGNIPRRCVALSRSPLCSYRTQPALWPILAGTCCIKLRHMQLQYAPCAKPQSTARIYPWSSACACCTRGRALHCAGCRLDIGDAPYAPNFQVDVHGRTFVWVWLRDPRPDSIPEADYSGCLGLPRLMSYLPACASSASRDSLLFQEPLPELTSLRGEVLWSAEASAALPVDGGLRVPGVCGAHWECSITLRRCPFHSQLLCPCCSFCRCSGQACQRPPRTCMCTAHRNAHRMRHESVACGSCGSWYEPCVSKPQGVFVWTVPVPASAMVVQARRESLLPRCHCISWNGQSPSGHFVG